MIATAASLVVVSGTAWGSIAHPGVVSEDPVNTTPNLVATTAIAKPHVDAIATSGDTVYAGGRFESVTSGSQTFKRMNFMAFSSTSGAMSTAVAPSFDGTIFAVQTLGSSIYVGGQFRTVNGVTRPALAKISAVDGRLDTTFKPNFTGGQVNELQIYNGKLIVGGSSGTKLMALDPATGANTGYLSLPITDPIPNAWGGVSVYSFAINPAGDRLIATGNFQTVAGQSRTRFFMVDLGAQSATLASWYYPGFAKPCSSTAARRIAYLDGVDFDPTGTYFVVTATGQIPKYKTDVWHSDKPNAANTTVCDGAGRFNVNDNTKPVWINYTGGDSVWSVAATGAAVYVQGHFQWLDNPDGYASMDGGGAASRKGIGAIDPTTGKALPWNPSKPASLGGKVLRATPDGLWVGSDSTKFGGEYHRGIAFAPLNG